MFADLLVPEYRIHKFKEGKSQHLRVGGLLIKTPDIGKNFLHSFGGSGLYLLDSIKEFLQLLLHLVLHAGLRYINILKKN